MGDQEGAVGHVSLSPTEYLDHLKTGVGIAGVVVPRVVLPEEHDVLLRRMRFHCLDWGNAGRRPILFLHGGGLTAHTWDLACLAFRDEYHCLALDQRGHGDSEWSPEMDYSVEAHQGDIAAFVDHLGLDGFVLVGMSMGGLNAIAYASRNVARVAALVLVDVGPEVRIDGARRILAFTAAPAELDSVDEFVQRALEFNPLRDPRLLRRSLLHNLRRQANGKWTWKYDQRHRGKIDVREFARRNRELWTEVPKIMCPTLVVRGARSDVFLDEDAAKLAATLPQGEWVRIEGAGHTVQGDNPKALVGALRSFLARRVPAGPHRDGPGAIGALLLVKVNVDPAVEEEFNRWYDEEHIPRLCKVPGVRSGRRFVNPRGPHRYIAVYELESKSVMKSQAWVEAAGTPWTEKMRARFTDLAWEVHERYVPRTTDTTQGEEQCSHVS